MDGDKMYEVIKSTVSEIIKSGFPDDLAPDEKEQFIESALKVLQDYEDYEACEELSNLKD